MTSILIADYNNPQHGNDIVYLLDQYARDPMGGGVPLADEVKAKLVGGLAHVPNAFTLLCYVDNKPAGLVNCFQGYSTFKASPLLNIHDVVVLAEFRGLGLSQKMLAKVDEIAYERGCCKVTLEVLSGNNVAQNAYIKAGFEGYELDPEAGYALFWQKNLTLASKD